MKNPLETDILSSLSFLVTILRVYSPDSRLEKDTLPEEPT